MFKSSPGVRRPLLYIAAAAFGIALMIPLAISSGQTGEGGIFDECFGAACDGHTKVADVR